jgi:hypothetical protein
MSGNTRSAGRIQRGNPYHFDELFTAPPPGSPGGGAPNCSPSSCWPPRCGGWIR